MGHMHIHGTGLTVKVEAPGFLQELFAAEDESAVFGESEEQIEFLGAQIEGLGGQVNRAPGRIDRQVAKLDGSRVRRVSFPAPQNRFDARYKLTRIERLGQVIIGAKLQAKDLINIFITGSEHQNGRWVLQSTQTPANL